MVRTSALWKPTLIRLRIERTMQSFGSYVSNTLSWRCLIVWFGMGLDSVIFFIKPCNQCRSMSGFQSCNQSVDYSNCYLWNAVVIQLLFVSVIRTILLQIVTITIYVTNILQQLIFMACCGNLAIICVSDTDNPSFDCNNQRIGDKHPTHLSLYLVI